MLPNECSMPVPPSFHEGLLTVTDTMRRNMAIVRTGTPLLDVALMMEQSPFCHVLIQDQHNAIVGIVSHEDLARHTAEDNLAGCYDWHTRPIEDLMLTRLETATVNQPASATGISAESDIPCIPIVEQGRVTGVMTPDDVLVSWSLLEPVLRAAGTDDVTQLANRGMFMRRLADEWDRSSRSQEPLALILFDIDCFKQVNDQCGHLLGDQVLAGVGRCIRDSLRSYDMVARIGGDEFAAICSNSDSDSVELPIRRIRKAVHELPVPQKLNRDRLTLSIGAAITRSGFEELTTDNLFSQADACLYHSKAAGRDRAFRVILNGSDPVDPEPVGNVDYSEGSVDYILHPQTPSRQIPSDIRDADHTAQPSVDSVFSSGL